MTNEKTAYMEWLDVVQQEPNSVVTVGTFDGVHVGHRAILDYLVRRAREVGSSSTVVTFDPHPREIVGSGVVALLTTIEERAASCREIGIDRFVVVPFTESFSKLTPREFVNDVLIERVGMREIVIGHDHHFGYGRS